ncbi:MAG: S-layer homology domain-containing protein [Eubacteriales bacterium]
MKQKLTALLLCLTLCIPWAAPVSALETTQDAVIQVVGALEIMTGDENGELHLSNAVTRAEFAKMLVCASVYKDSVSPVANTSPFRDVPYTHWAASYIKTAVEQGWVTGYLDGTYRPDNTITLEEAVTASLKLLGYTTSDFPGSFPYGQMALYESLGMDENISAGMGSTLTRQDCMYLLYNLLNTKTKDTGVIYCTTLGYEVDANDEISLTHVINDTMTGPIISTGGLMGIPFTPQHIYRNGVRVEASAIAAYDVLYYSQSMSTVWAYNNKVSGTYESASPNSDYPTAVTVAGVSYELGNSTAAYQLSSVGTFHIGDTVTLLLGKDGTVVSAVDATAAEQTVAGVIVEVGTKNYTDSNGNPYSGRYIRVVATDGGSYEFKVDSVSGYSQGDVVKVQVSGGTTQVQHLSNAGLTGTVNSSSYTIGSRKVATAANIVDVADSTVTKIALSRLDGVSLSSDSVLYYQTNSAGEITDLILDDVTGDSRSYGVVESVEKKQQSDSTGTTTTRVFQCNVNGQSMSLTTTGFSQVSSGPACFTMEDGQIDYIQNLTMLTGVTGVTSLSVQTSSGSFRLADNVLVYIRDGNQYYQSTLSQIVDSQEYTITAHYDKAQSQGGRVRVLLATPK